MKMISIRRKRGGTAGNASASGSPTLDSSNLTSPDGPQTKETSNVPGLSATAATPPRKDAEGTKKCAKRGFGGGGRVEGAPEVKVQQHGRGGSKKDGWRWMHMVQRLRFHEVCLVLAVCACMSSIFSCKINKAVSCRDKKKKKRRTRETERKKRLKAACRLATAAKKRSYDRSTCCSFGCLFLLSLFFPVSVRHGTPLTAGGGPFVKPASFSVHPLPPPPPNEDNADSHMDHLRRSKGFTHGRWVVSEQFLTQIHIFMYISE